MALINTSDAGPAHPQEPQAQESQHYATGLPSVIISGSTEVRLARSTAEVEAAQALRYRIFYEEMGARPTADMSAAKRDFDSYDAIADHLLVLDHDRGDAVVGTYRLLRGAVAEANNGFYSAGEYDISPLLRFDGEVMELGRSCVDEGYRTRSTMQLLWRGIAAYVFQFDVKLMFGCASFPGSDPAEHRDALNYLYANHLAPEAIRPKALEHLCVDMRAPDSDPIPDKKILASLPPLIKGYLRLGGWIGDGAVVDKQFNTTDICIVVETDSVTDKYYKHYERRSGGGPA